MRVRVAGSPALLREAVAALLRDEPGLNVVDPVDLGRLPRPARHGPPEVRVVLHASAAVTGALLAACRDARTAGALLVLAPDPAAVAVDVLAVGPSRVAVLDVARVGSGARLRAAIRALAGGGVLLDPAAAAATARGLAASPVATLTARELDVLALLADGWGNAEISARLLIAPKTVEVTVTNLLRKLRPADGWDRLDRRVVAALAFHGLAGHLREPTPPQESSPV